MKEVKCDKVSIGLQRFSRFSVSWGLASGLGIPQWGKQGKGSVNVFSREAILSCTGRSVWVRCEYCSSISGLNVSKATPVVSKFYFPSLMGKIRTSLTAPKPQAKQACRSILWYCEITVSCLRSQPFKKRSRWKHQQFKDCLLAQRKV